MKLTEGDPSVVSKYIEQQVVQAYGNTRRGYVNSGHVEHDRGVGVVHLEVVHRHDETGMLQQKQLSL